MKLMVASDVHGSAYYCEEVVEAFAREGAENLVLLGDLLYHGPRNDLPREYDPKKVISLLNPLSGKILAVRGNCEAEVDQMVLDFPCMADYATIFVDGLTIFATHGHIFGETNPPKLGGGEVLLCGHTHVPKMADHGFIYMNPGSAAIPKEGTWHGYMTYEDRKFAWKDLENEGKVHLTHGL